MPKPEEISIIYTHLSSASWIWSFSLSNTCLCVQVSTLFTVNKQTQVHSGRPGVPMLHWDLNTAHRENDQIQILGQLVGVRFFLCLSVSCSVLLTKTASVSDLQPGLRLPLPAPHLEPERWLSGRKTAAHTEDPQDQNPPEPPPEPL